MLADDRVDVQSGLLSTGLHRPATWLHELIDFIVEQLPIWRDRPNRPRLGGGETLLTSQLCAHLNGATRQTGWDVLQFRTEEPDEVKVARRIDLVPAPRGVEIWVEGRQFTDFQALMPIECKRLPTPRGAGREKREYAHVFNGSTGGMQRFKAGHHGQAHSLALMIGFVQDDRIGKWSRRINRWIGAFARIALPGWVIDEILVLQRCDAAARLIELQSLNGRVGNLSPILIRHVWIEV